MFLKSERFTLKNAGGMELKVSGTAAFPIPLDWNEVASICGSYDGDALLVLETFDSDSRIIVGKPIVRKRKRKGVKVKELRYPATLIMEIQSGWRIYDVYNKNIVDENRFKEEKDFIAYGSSADNAIRNLPSKSSAIKESGIFAGRQYGFRISPMWVKVRRTYFTGRHDDLKLAKSYVKRGDWDAAIEIWKNLVNDLNEKIARRSAYNMAIASEVRGELDMAIEWANKSKKIGEKKARNYIKVLHIRKNNKEKLKKQLNN
jgi:tetratricopeptide (TPR) repeat protein